MYQITIKIPKYNEDGQQASDVNLKTIEAEAIAIMDKPISNCSNGLFDSITFNKVESSDTSMFDDLVVDYSVTIEANEILEGV